MFVTGPSFGGIGDCCDYATIKYSSSGSKLWTRRYNGPANTQDEARAIATDRSGNVFVTGNSFGTNGMNLTDDYATVGYSNTGVALWTNREASFQCSNPEPSGNPLAEFPSQPLDAHHGETEQTQRRAAFGDGDSAQNHIRI